MTLYVSNGDMAEVMGVDVPSFSKFLRVAGRPQAPTESIRSRRSAWQERGYPVDAAVAFLYRHSRHFGALQETKLRELARPTARAVAS
ncbi:MAG: hypothetical protein OXQ92_14735 [Boseongicola sp.]|nr:hypothetical protein [Boseongicola sp.]MDD9977871.1 hypothetical protein [Boseongicola sp.]